MPYSLVNGKIIDGTGSAEFTADVLVKDGVIAAVGTDLAPEGEIIDARGKIVCPGFIDMHSHSSLAWLSEPAIEPKIHQGVTTELAGVDGLAPAPIKSEDVPQWRTHLSGLDGNPPLDWSWSSFGDYLSAIGKTGTNPALLAGHGNIRLHAMGMANRKATPEELGQMCQVLRRCFEEGAFGLSSGLVYSPCTYANHEELVALAKVVAEFGGFFDFHMRYEGAKVLDSIREVSDIGKQSGAAIHISHLKAMGRNNWGTAGKIRGLIDDLRSGGIDITCDQYPYTAASTMLAAVLPPWAHAYGTAKLAELLRSGEILERAEQDMIHSLPEWESYSAAAGWDNVYVSSVQSERNQPVVGQNISTIAANWQVSPFEATIRLLLEEDFAVGMVFFVMCEEDVEEIMRAPWQMVGTDGLLGGKPHPRAYGTYPRILGHYVRDRQVLTLPEAIRKATSLPAQRLGLKDRGRIAPGLAADICVFDPETVIDKGTYVDSRVFPAGIEHVFINGEPVVQAGQSTGKLSGKVLRRSR